MSLDRAKFRRACDPSKTRVFKDPEDKKYYIDFASVRDVLLAIAIPETTRFHLRK